MSKKQVKIGEVYNRLTIKDLKLELTTHGNKTYAYCKCRCGFEDLIRCRATDLVQNNIKSCGCLKAEKASKNAIKKNTTHNLTNHRLYSIYNGIKSRCYNKNQYAYKNYGAKGILMCDIWKNDFIEFYNWAIKNGYEDHLTLDRIDNSKGYDSKNCRWSTRLQQANNRTNNININVYAFGETKNVFDWIFDKRCKVKHARTILYRLGSGWSAEKAISTYSERKNIPQYQLLYKFIQEKYPDIFDEFKSTL